MPVLPALGLETFTTKLKFPSPTLDLVPTTGTQPLAAGTRSPGPAFLSSKSGDCKITVEKMIELVILGVSRRTRNRQPLLGTLCGKIILLLRWERQQLLQMLLVKCRFHSGSARRPDQWP
ncbi:hypothetical protein NL676_031795 [Syzygium grande]|nr:hypothetical protein NL676_031795 [Syzygium grande]